VPSSGKFVISSPQGVITHNVTIRIFIAAKIINFDIEVCFESHTKNLHGTITSYLSGCYFSRS
jgi:hypothetical protein